MCTVSFILHGTMDVTIYNQSFNIELIPSVYFCNCGTYYEHPVKRMDAGVMKTDVRFDLDQEESGGILVYEIQRKGRFDHQSNIATKVIEEALKMVRLLITWKFKRFGESKVNIMLVEYDDKLVPNEDKLAQLYGKLAVILSKCYDPHINTRLMYDNIAIGPICEVVWKEIPELKITISERATNKYTMKPMWIDSGRQVSFLIIMCSC
jgi:hypothetical protein